MMKIKFIIYIIKKSKLTGLNVGRFCFLNLILSSKSPFTSINHKNKE